MTLMKLLILWEGILAVHGGTDGAGVASVADMICDERQRRSISFVHHKKRTVYNAHCPLASIIQAGAQSLVSAVGCTLSIARDDTAQNKLAEYGDTATEKLAIGYPTRLRPSCSARRAALAAEEAHEPLHDATFAKWLVGKGERGKETNGNFWA
uniref:Uncharacterized protein n=1 Tax=Oryza punctata TaxID=4537 RepID=A0A0E0MCW2_ORYPU